MTWLLIVRGLLGRAWTWLTANTTHLLLAALAAALLWGFVQRHEAAKWHRVAESTFAAQKPAGRDQAAVNHVPAAKSQTIAEKSDAEAPTLYEAGRRAGVAYADANRVRAACTVGGPDLPGADHAVAGDDGPGDPADMVAISRPDFDLCTGNSLRLAKVHQDAEALIEAGVAVRSVAPAN